MNKFKTYLFRYNYAGESWGFEIQAENPEDAKARVARLAFAAYDGELIARVPVSLGLPTKAAIAARNRTHSLIRRLVAKATKAV